MLWTKSDSNRWTKHPVYPSEVKGPIPWTKKLSHDWKPSHKKADKLPDIISHNTAIFPVIWGKWSARANFIHHALCEPSQLIVKGRCLLTAVLPIARGWCSRTTVQFIAITGDNSVVLIRFTSWTKFSCHLNFWLMFTVHNITGIVFTKERHLIILRSVQLVLPTLVV